MPSGPSQPRQSLSGGAPEGRRTSQPRRALGIDDWTQPEFLVVLCQWLALAVGLGVVVVVIVRLTDHEPAGGAVASPRDVVGAVAPAAPDFKLTPEPVPAAEPVAAPVAVPSPPPAPEPPPSPAPVEAPALAPSPEPAAAVRADRHVKRRQIAVAAPPPSDQRGAGVGAPATPAPPAPPLAAPPLAAPAPAAPAPATPAPAAPAPSAVQPPVPERPKPESTTAADRPLPNGAEAH